jgi:hypothetical protein
MFYINKLCELELSSSYSVVTVCELGYVLLVCIKSNKAHIRQHLYLRTADMQIAICSSEGLLEGHRDKSCLFQRGDYRSKGHKTEKLPGSIPAEYVFCSSGSKHDRKTAPRQSVFSSAMRSQDVTSQTGKLLCVRVAVKMLGLRIIVICCMISTRI